MRLPHLLVIGAVFVVAGCGGGKQSGPTTKPSDKAAKDPFGYSPDWSDTEIGGTRRDTGFDREGLKRDMGHVIMP